MVMHCKSILILSGAALATAGCAPVDPGFGEAARYDMAIQTIDPDPQYPADASQPGDHGEKAQKATERYRKGQTKALRRESAGGGSAGGAGGGAGGGNTPGS
jgi:hypothetical protein